VTLARLIRADAGVLLESMIVEHERDGRAWKAEWAAFPDICLLTGVALTMGRSLTEGLVTYPDRMLRNLVEQRGYVLSEGVMRELAGRIGKQSAHQAVYQAAMAGRERGQSFREALEATPEVAGRLSPAELDRLLDLGEAMGPGPQLVDRVIERAERIRNAEAASWS
jgi:adenylosuccinate lyase